MIAWCGSRSEGLGWLSDRCAAVAPLKLSEVLTLEAIDSLCDQHPRRLVLSVENRLDYPQAEIRHLQRVWPEIPWALAVGSWFDGSRRTGIGATGHLCLPWYRWWDGWAPWLRGVNTELLNPWPRRLPSRFDGDMLRRDAQGVIVCNCRQTAEGWLAGLACAPSCTRLLSLREFRASLEQDTTAPDWILWDDTCLDTFLGPDCLAEVCPLFADVRRRYPQGMLIAATCMPRWSDWQQWMAAGASELIVKPTHGVFLQAAPL